MINCYYSHKCLLNVIYFKRYYLKGLSTQKRKFSFSLLLRNFNRTFCKLTVRLVAQLTPHNFFLVFIYTCTLLFDQSNNVKSINPVFTFFLSQPTNGGTIVVSTHYIWIEYLIPQKNYTLHLQPLFYYIIRSGGKQKGLED